MQFSLRMLFAAVAVVGIGAALWVAEPSWRMGAIEVLFSGCVLASAVLLSLDSTGRARAWWMGVLVHCVMWAVIYSLALHPVLVYSKNDPFFQIQSVLLEFSMHIHALLTGFATAPILGLFCVLMHWLLIRQPQGPQD